MSMNADEKLDEGIRPMKQPNKEGSPSTEAVEERPSGHTAGAHLSSGARRSGSACEPSSRRSRWSCANVMHDPIAQAGAWVKQMLQGRLNYYAVSGNPLWLETLRRRSQKADLTWERFNNLVDRFFK